MSDECTPGSVLVAVNKLRRLNTGQLRERYAEVFGEPTNSRNRRYVELPDMGSCGHPARVNPPNLQSFAGFAPLDSST